MRVCENALLCKAYISDSPTSPHTLLALYADDITMMARDKDCLVIHEDLQKLSAKLNHFQEMTYRN